ncbi:hypothetical protein GCM10008905_18030 [Clostridium malenominatum]|uniref:Flagellar protein FliT n=1 Tax=Clostridium malenominatum TaxID=1539 RepID=A0ABN1IZ06_9CLOT
MILKDYLISFNQLTLELIAKINSQNLECLEEIMDKRQRIIEKIENIPYTQEEFIKFCIEINLLDNNEKLQGLLNKKKKEIRQDITELNTNRKANQGYNQKFYTKSIVFTKKI